MLNHVRVTRETTSDRFSKAVKSFDIFGQSFKLKLDNRMEVQRSFMGSFCSLLLFLMLGAFVYSKVLIMKENREVDIYTTQRNDVFDTEYKFSSEQGLMMAAALTTYDSSTEIEEDPTYGELIIKHYGWGYDDSEIGSASN